MGRPTYSNMMVKTPNLFSMSVTTDASKEEFGHCTCINPTKHAPKEDHDSSSLTCIKLLDIVLNLSLLEYNVVRVVVL